MATSSSFGTAIQVLINGCPVQGLLRASLTTSNCFSADTYALTFAIGPSPFGDVSFWSTLSSAYVEIILASSVGSQQQGLVTGMVDIVRIDPIRMTVSISGRDLSSTLIDSYRQQDFVNQTASEIAATIAENHNLLPIVTPTSDIVGRYYDDGYTRLSVGQFSRLRSDWDLLVQLARENGFDVFVQGTSLFFQPPDLLAELPVRIPFRNVKAVRFEQNLCITSGANALVQSWNSQNMAAYASNATGGDLGTTQPITNTNTQPFLFSASNFTSQQVSDTAARFAAELHRLGTVMHIEMPWNVSLSPRTLILIDETESPLDTTYQIDHIERHFSTTSGSCQIIRAIAV